MSQSSQKTTVVQQPDLTSLDSVCSKLKQITAREEEKEMDVTFGKQIADELINSFKILAQ